MLANTYVTAELNAGLDRLRPFRHSRLRILAPIALLLLAFYLAWLTQLVWQSSTLLVFAFGVAAASTLFGLTAGLITALLSTLVVDFFFLPPILSLNLDRSSFWIAVQYCFVALIVHVGARYASASIRRKAKIGVLGQLDGVVDGEAYGWALDADHPQTPVRVLIYVDHHPVAETAAVYYRPDVAELMHCSGRYGFYVDVSKYCANDTEALVEARFSLVQPLTNSPVKAVIPGRRVASASPTVLFMHLPRSAGTAFREAITSNYKQAEIAYIYPDPPGFPISNLALLPIQQRSSVRLVIGHFQYGVHDLIRQETTYAAVVRHPVSRVISQHFYLVHHDSASIRVGDRQLNLEEALEGKVSVDLDNAMVRYFAGIDESAVPPGALQRDAYELAVHHIQKRFAFIAHQECAEESYAEMCRRFDWSAGTKMARVNLATDADKLVQKHYQCVEHYNKWDCLLYDEIVRLFPPQKFYSASAC